MVELTDIERLVVEQAFVNAVGKDVATKDPSNLRGRIDAAMRESYYRNPMAGKSYDLKLLGQKVGTYSLTVSNSKPQQITMSLEVDDKDEFLRWAGANGFIRQEIDMDAVMASFKADGVVPDGCTPVEVVIPEVLGGEVTRTTVKVDAAEVARVLGPQLESVTRALMSGVGEND